MFADSCTCSKGAGEWDRVLAGDGERELHGDILGDDVEAGGFFTEVRRDRPRVSPRLTEVLRLATAPAAPTA